MKYVVKTFLLLVGVVGISFQLAEAEPFTPGNLVLTDATNDRLIEVELDIENETGTIVQIVEWPLGDMQRRRPLGFAFDPLGNAYVGLTGVPQSATESVQYPDGIAQIMRIAPDGTQTFHTLPPEEINKITVVSSFNANEVFVMRNTPLTPPTYHFRVRFDGDEIVDTTKFLVSADSGSFGEVLMLEDGTIWIPLQNQNQINVYSAEGGEPIGSIPTQKGYISFAYDPDKDYLLALVNGQKIIDKIDFEGNILDTMNFAQLDGINESWNVIFLGDGSDRFVLAEKTETGSNYPNSVFIYDANDFFELPKIITLDLDAPSSLFDFHFVPVPTAIDSWDLF
ncbi:MAG: hypothetical protein ACOX5R_05680 [bacterium]|jgi:DNA-binding beta-propeller fold protein YncE